MIPAEPMVRVDDWGHQLSQYIADQREKEAAGELSFDWVSLNCAIFTNGAIKVITGQDFYQPFLDVTSGISAIKTLKGLGFNSMEEYIEANAPERGVVMAQRGDLVLAQGLSNEGLVCGIADPPFFWSVTEQGLYRGSLYPDPDSPNTGVVRAFAIGE